MILFYNTYITNTPANYERRHVFTRGNTGNYDSISVTKYSLSSLAHCYDWSKVIINLELDDKVFTEKDYISIESYIRSEFKSDVLLSRRRITKQNEWKEVYKHFNDDLILYLGNNDHVWIDSNNQHLQKLVSRAKKSKNIFYTISTSHWPENIRWAKSGYIDLNQFTPNNLHSNYKIEDDCVSHDGINIDSLNIISKDLYYDWIFTCDWGGVEIRRTDGVAALGGESILTTRHRNNLQLPTQEILVPFKEQFRHFDGYMHQNIGNDICPVLFIPEGFFESNVKVRFGYDDYKKGWVNLNPKKPYFASDISGADDKILPVDIPLFWKDKIVELDVNSDIDEEEMIQYRLHSILQMIYSDERYNPYIEKDLEIRVLNEYLKNYKNYTL